MDPLTALSLASNVVQFVDFASKTISKSYEFHRSTTGALREHDEIALVAADLKSRTDSLKTSPGPADSDLVKLSDECHSVAEELLLALEELKVKGKSTQWKSLRKALRSVWSKDKISALEARLRRFKDQINVVICVQLRFQIVSLSEDQLAAFDKFDQSSQRHLQHLVSAIKNSEDVFGGRFDDQEQLLQSNHQVTQTTIQDAFVESQIVANSLHQATRIELGASIDLATHHQDSRAQIMELHIEQQHRLTRNEITTVLDSYHTNLSQDVTGLQRGIEHLEAEMKRLTQQLQQLIIETQNTRLSSERQALRERGNSLTVLIMSMEILATELKALLASLLEEVEKLCEKLKLNFSQVLRTLNEASTRERLYSFGRSTVVKLTSSDCSDESAGRALAVYYRHRYLSRVGVRFYYADPMVNDHIQYVREKTIKQKYSLGELGHMIKHDDEMALFVWFAASISALCRILFGGDHLTRKLFATVLGVLKDPEWRFFRTIPGPHPAEAGFYDLHKINLKLALRRILDPISSANIRWKDSFDVWGTASGLPGFNSAKVAGQRLRKDVEAWIELAELTGLLGDAVRAWIPHNNFPHSDWLESVVTGEKLFGYIHDEQMMSSTKPRNFTYNDLMVTELVDLAIFLIAVLAQPSNCEVCEYHSQMTSIETSKHFIRINSGKNPKLWTFVMALHRLGGPFQLRGSLSISDSGGLEYDIDSSNRKPN